MEDKRLDKIRALLAKAESTNHPEEAKAFTAKAQELMTKWAIDEAMLAAAGGKAESIKIVTVNVDIGYSPYQTPKERLLGTCCTNQGVRVVLTTSKKFYNEDGTRIRNKKGEDSFERTNVATLVGTETAVDLAVMLYTSLLAQSATEFMTEDVQAEMTNDCPHPGHRIRWRNSWMLGYVSAVSNRLYQARKSAETSAGSSVALVLVDQKSKVDAAFTEMFPSVRKVQTSNNIHAGAAASGREAGLKADLGQKRMAGSKGALR